MDHHDGRLAAMRSFAEMYRAKRFDIAAFDADDGFLVTAFSGADRMPLRFFVEYNNRWWFSIIRNVVVPVVTVDADSGQGLIVLDIRYTDDLVLQAVQRVEFDGALITRIQTYLDPAFFDADDPLVRLDAQGNWMWLRTGYDLVASARLATHFFDTPKGRAFAADPLSASAVSLIKERLVGLVSASRAGLVDPDPR